MRSSLSKSGSGFVAISFLRRPPTASDGGKRTYVRNAVLLFLRGQVHGFRNSLHFGCNLAPYLFFGSGFGGKRDFNRRDHFRSLAPYEVRSVPPRCNSSHRSVDKPLVGLFRFYCPNAPDGSILGDRDVKQDFSIDALVAEFSRIFRFGAKQQLGGMRAAAASNLSLRDGELKVHAGFSAGHFSGDCLASAFFHDDLRGFARGELQPELALRVGMGNRVPAGRMRDHPYETGGNSAIRVDDESCQIFLRRQ
jgi:hypothetical protein